MSLATVTAAEVWGMTASIVTILVLVLGGVWKISRLVGAQVSATVENTKAIALLTGRLTRVEGAVRRAPADVVKGIAENGEAD